MKTVTETTENMIWDVAALAAGEWYRLAVRNPYAPLFLWWRKAIPGERMALPLVSADKPNELYSQSIQLSNAWTKEIATRKIVEAMRTLPILGN